MAFDVGSVKTSAYGDLRDVLNAYFDTWMRGGPGTDDPGRITFKNASLKSLIVSAYGVKRYRISGPDWLDAGGFNIIAKVPPGVSKQRVGVMLQESSGRTIQADAPPREEGASGLHASGW